MLEEHVDLFAGDFNGAAWRRSNGNTRQPTSIIEEAFADTDLPMPPGPTPLWGPGAIPGRWIDVCGFIKPPDSCENGRSAYDGAFTIHHGTQVWLHLDFVDNQYAHVSRGKHEQRVLFKERSSPYPPRQWRILMHYAHHASKPGGTKHFGSHQN